MEWKNTERKSVRHIEGLKAAQIEEAQIGLPHNWRQSVVVHGKAGVWELDLTVGPPIHGCRVKEPQKKIKQPCGQSLLSYFGCVLATKTLHSHSSICSSKQSWERGREVTEEHQSGSCRQSWCPARCSCCGSAAWHRPAEQRSCPGRSCCPGSESGSWGVWAWRSRLQPHSRVSAGSHQDHGLFHTEEAGLNTGRRRRPLRSFSSRVQVRSFVCDWLCDSASPHPGQAHTWFFFPKPQSVANKRTHEEFDLLLLPVACKRTLISDTLIQNIARTLKKLL